MTNSACADRDLLSAAVEEAGILALKFWRLKPKSWGKGETKEPVSEADLAVDALLRKNLLKARPNYGWLSEESPPDHTRIEKTHAFIIDPIDGTRQFLNGEQNFSICAAVSINGSISAAAISVPAHGLIYKAARGYGASRDGLALRVSQTLSLDKANGLISLRELSSRYWKAKPKICAHDLEPISLRFCELASGKFDCLISLKPTKEWDAAAGELIAIEAGATVTNANGLPNLYNKEDSRLLGYIAANPILHRKLLKLSIIT